MKMTEMHKPLPIRRAGLVSWSQGENGSHLVRNRSTGETFQLGHEEQFLLEHLDGQHSADEVCAAFALRFGQPLSADDLSEFLTLAAQGDLLEPESAEGRERQTTHPRLALEPTNGLEPSTFNLQPSTSPDSTPRSALRTPHSPVRRLASRSLSVVAQLLELLASGPQQAALRLRLFDLRRFRYVPRADDIFIVTYPRSGTTWMQMILYQLTTDGSMNIPHIAEYSPCFEGSARSARGFDTRPSPRIFKSHLPYPKVPKGAGRYIYVARDGRDVALSCYHLCRNFGTYWKSFDEYFEEFLRGKSVFGSWFKHVEGWWQHRQDPNVLFLTYEELKSDLARALERIIDFCHFDIAPERLPGIVERCGFAFMKAHESKFDATLGHLWENGTRLDTFIRGGRTGDGARELTEEQKARFERIFQARLQQHGFAWPAQAPQPA
jgi:hypothetical protein